MASLASVLVSLYKESDRIPTVGDAMVPLYERLVEARGPPAPLVTNQSLDDLLQIIRQNQAARKCFDVSKDKFRQCLQYHSLVE